MGWLEYGKCTLRLLDNCVLNACNWLDDENSYELKFSINLFDNSIFHKMHDFGFQLLAQILHSNIIIPIFKNSDVHIHKMKLAKKWFVLK